VLVQLLLQEVAWDEGSRGHMRAERAAVVAQYHDIGDLQHEPLFCAETALKVALTLPLGLMSHRCLSRAVDPVLDLLSYFHCKLCDAGTRPHERRSASTPR
jgi:hypothetical protein